ncbi:hypothetical protein [Stenotrophomonas lacuserhaii]|uniref:hypothetical protein n=1 Tax=Stenotrophomonas lacuserhaii TaxID=2760084 RepID=UPI0005AED20D|nr:hypothetical protein [Stenotrophomonas lacuserhaii]KIP87455.1 hypothetical protein SN15_01785 [Stenotrophomonas maltophilia]
MELAGWRTFFELYPFDDLHRYHRPATAIAGSFGAKPEQILQYLSPEPTDSAMSDADRDITKALGFNS